jgi:hypothetical protein
VHEEVFSALFVEEVVSSPRHVFAIFIESQMALIVSRGAYSSKINSLRIFDSYTTKDLSKGNFTEVLNSFFNTAWISLLRKTEGK